MSAQLNSVHQARISVFITARDERVRAGLWSLLESEPGIELLAATADVADLIRLLGRVAPAVVVVDESVFGTAGVGWLRTLAAAAPHSAFVVVGMHDHPAFVTRAREAGAADYVRLDEADRLGRSVVDAATLLAPFGAERLRTGSRAVKVVPAPGSD